jgi:hypothetical protein
MITQYAIRRGAARKVLLLTLLVFSCMTLQAQSSPQAKARVAEIRKMYADAKDLVEKNGKGNTPRSDTEIVSQYVVPGTGPTKEVIHYYYELQTDEDLGVPFYQSYLITRKYNVAAREFYQEFLYDKKSHELVFAFLQEKLPNGSANETRYYWGESGMVHETVKGERLMDEVFTLRKGRELVDALNMLMNQDY